MEKNKMKRELMENIIKSALGKMAKKIMGKERRSFLASRLGNQLDDIQRDKGMKLGKLTRKDHEDLGKDKKYAHVNTKYTSVVWGNLIPGMKKNYLSGKK